MEPHAAALPPAHSRSYTRQTDACAHGTHEVELKPASDKDSNALLPPLGRMHPRARCCSPLCASLLVNMLLLAGLVLLATRHGAVSSRPDDARRACHGNGMLYADAAVCECFDCWTGTTCGEKLSSGACTVDVSSGTPYIFEDYWLQHPSAAVTITPAYHIGYGYDMPPLEAAIRSLHDRVGNARTEGKHVVIGVGSTQLIASALHAMGKVSGEPGRASAVWSQKPFYSGYRMPPALLQSQLFQWNESDTPPSSGHVIELVTSPNNPDGHRRRPASDPLRRSVIMDHAYYWPHFVGITEPGTLRLGSVGLLQAIRG
ncbi:hypothetical protein AB1Y20_015480 [Prymnesium parvum]|uniref:Alliinase C-terminal domain-containing protein n=1 Tax=Prymnesium parvum TaxID=97485 RepID=A0AB34JWW2_PRYPA